MAPIIARQYHQLDYYIEIRLEILYFNVYPSMGDKQLKLRPPIVFMQLFYARYSNENKIITIFSYGSFYKTKMVKICVIAWQILFMI